MRGALLRAALMLDLDRTFPTAVDALTDASPVVRQSAAAGLLLAGGIGGCGCRAVLEWLVRCSRRTPHRCPYPGRWGGAYYQLLIPLFPTTTLTFAGRQWRLPARSTTSGCGPVVKSLAQPSTTQTAVAARGAAAITSLPAMTAAWQNGAASRSRCNWLAPARGSAHRLPRRCPGEDGQPDVEIRNDVLALQRCGYRAGAADVTPIRAAIIDEGHGAAWTSAALIDLAGDEALGLLRTALNSRSRGGVPVCCICSHS